MARRIWCARLSVTRSFRQRIDNRSRRPAIRPRSQAKRSNTVTPSAVVAQSPLHDNVDEPAWHVDHAPHSLAVDKTDYFRILQRVFLDIVLTDFRRNGDSSA